VARRNSRQRSDTRPAVLAVNEVLDDDAGEKAHPNLYSLLAPTFTDGECKRLGATLRIKVVGAHYVVTVQCPSEELQCTLLIPTLEELLTKVDQMVQSSETKWVPDYESQKRARQQAKK
jgi:hypothetical protein